jgi:glycosyltransferase involved in cell wall biosynthesis
MGISVTIQTYNRAEELRTTLRTLALVDSKDVADYEVIIIDNNSSDHTPQVVSDLAPDFAGKLRYVREMNQGLSHARNRATAEARYEIVAFLDDDVNVDRNWLRNLTSAFESGDYAAIGGRAILAYPAARPAWLGDRAEGLLTKMDYGSERRRAGADELFGVNLSFKRGWLEELGGFRTDLGRVGNCLVGSEETDLLDRIVAAGGKLLYEPSAMVEHRVPASRLRRRWFWSRCYWGYRGQARMTAADQLRAFELLRLTWRLGRSVWSIIRAAVAHGPSSEECFHHTRVLASRWGYWVGVVGRVLAFRRPAESIDPVKSGPIRTRTRAHDLQHQPS